jgi:DNA-binding response OmpR family regulator
VKRVLIVERDSLLRGLIAEWLAQSGAEAVYPDGGAPLDVDVVLVDVEDVRQAREVLSTWRRAYPRAEIIAASARFCASGTANDAMASRLGATQVLAKPFTRSELWTVLRLPIAATLSAVPSRQ